MFLILLTFLTALAISTVAIYYSVLGLTAIFAAAFWPIVIMGTVLEVAKLVTASWLYQNWETIPRLLKAYLTTAIIILMVITSMGIFGFLSKAHVEQTAPSSIISSKIAQLEEQLVRENAKIEKWQLDLDRLNVVTDERVDTLIDSQDDKLDQIYTRIDKDIATATTQANTNIQVQKDIIVNEQSRTKEIVDQLLQSRLTAFAKKPWDDKIAAARANETKIINKANNEIQNIQKELAKTIEDIKAQYQPQIDKINNSITELNVQAEDKTESIDEKIIQIEGYITLAYDNISDLTEEKFVLQSEIKQIEVEVGPIKYLAKLFVPGNDNIDFERVVTYVILLIIFVFDPLAVLLLIAANMSLKQRYGWNFEGSNAKTYYANEIITTEDQKKRMSDRIVDKPIIKEVVKEVVKEVPVFKTIEKIVEVPVEKIVIQEKIVEVPVEKIVEKETVIPVEQIIEREVPVEKEVIKYVEVENTEKVKALQDEIASLKEQLGKVFEAQADNGPIHGQIKTQEKVNAITMERTKTKEIYDEEEGKFIPANDYWGKPKNIKQAKPLSQDEYRKRTEQRIKDLVDKIREGSVIIEQLSEADQEAVNTYIKNLE